MSFQFPQNPADGAVATGVASDGSLIIATYSAPKNEWKVAKQVKPDPPAPFAAGGAVLAPGSADGQVLTWNQLAARWLAQAPAKPPGSDGGTFVKGTQVGADTPNPPTSTSGPLKPGMLQTTLENLHKELKVFNGTNWVEVLSEDTIKQLISAGSLFRGVVKETTLATLPTPALTNRGFYFSWTGAPGHVVSTADPVIGTDLAGEILQVGDWVQSDGVRWVHVPGDLLSKQRWDSLGSFAPWTDTSWEKGALVSYRLGFWRANALISPGDDAPENVPGNKWTDITPHPSIKLAELADVNDNVALQGEDGVLVWSEIDGEFVVSRTLQVDGIEFDVTGPGVAIEGLFQGDISLGKNLDTQVPSVNAVADYVDTRRLEDLWNSKDLNAAINGEFIAWDETNSKWVPKAASSSIAGLTDVDLTTPPTDTQVLSWNNTAARWMPRNGVYAIGDLTDVDVRTTAPAGGDYLAWLPASNSWANLPLVMNALSDVTLAGTPATGNLLRFNTDHWENWASDYVNKTYVDGRISNVIAGLEHEEAVLGRPNDPPALPSAYDLYIVGTAPTGAWVGHANELAEWSGTAWQFTSARSNEAHLVEDEAATYTWSGTAWVKVAVAATGGSSAQAGVGEIVAWIGDTFPTSDYLECQGQIVAVNTYADLHNVIGNKYNAGTAADGTSTFAIPDLRGYFLRGTKAGLGVGSSHQWTTGMPRSPFVTGNAGSHHHTSGGVAWGDGNGSYFGNTRPGGTKKLGNYDGDSDQSPLTSDDGNHTHPITGGDTETTPDNFVVKWLIRYRPINGGATGPRGPQGPAVDAYLKTESDAKYYSKTDADGRYYTKTQADANFGPKPCAVGVVNCGSRVVESGFGIASIEGTPGRPYPGYWRVHLSNPCAFWVVNVTVIIEAGTDPWNGWSKGMSTNIRWVDNNTFDVSIHDAGNMAATQDPPRMSILCY